MGLVSLHSQRGACPDLAAGVRQLGTEVFLLFAQGSLVNPTSVKLGGLDPDTPRNALPLWPLSK